MADEIPESFRSYRYDMYIADSKENEHLAAQVYGVYGILDELTAYMFGLHSDLMMFGYYIENAQSVSDFSDLVGTVDSDSAACAEFYYYIYEYFDYARRNYPKIYKEILNNDEFMYVCDRILTLTEICITQAPNYMSSLAEMFNNNGIEAEYTGEEFSVGGESVLLNTDYTNSIMNELMQSKYDEVYEAVSKSCIKALKKHLSNQEITSVKSPKKSQLKLSWKEFDDAEGYQIQYSADKSFKKKKTVTVKSYSKTKKKIENLKSGRKYYVRVRCFYKNSDGKKVYCKWSGVKSVKVK